MKNRNNASLNLDLIKEIFNGLNKVFKAMQNKKIIHRDLKLKNLLVKYIDNERQKFIVKLSDYGISRKMLSMSKKCSTYAGTIITMAPEILAGEEYDNKCDLWSLGVIIYQLFFKEYPYKADMQLAIYNKIKNYGKKILKRTKYENLDNLIDSLLIRDPNKRINYEEYFNHSFFKENLNK